MREFNTSKEAENMLSSLRKAAVFCTGEKSSRRMSERIREVEHEIKLLKKEESNKR